MTVLLRQFVLVRKHAVATIDITPGEWLRGLLEEVGPHLGFVSHMAWVRIELMALPSVSFLRTPLSYALDAERVSS